MRVVMYCLNTSSNTRFPDICLNSGDTMVLGRSMKADYPMPNENAISSRHLEIVCDAHTVSIRDLGSTNGTFLNGNRIRSAQLKHHDQFRIGLCEFRVQLEAGEQVASAFETDNLESTPPASNEMNFSVDLFDSLDRNAGGKSSHSAVSHVTHSGRSETPTNVSTTNDVETHSTTEAVQLSVEYPLARSGRNGKIVVPNGQTISVGRGSQSDVQIDDSDLSYLHFRLRLHQRTATLIDARSKTGTMLNGVRIEQAELRTGDVITAGGLTFKVALTGVQEANRAAIATADAPTARLPREPVSSPSKHIVTQRRFASGLIGLQSAPIDFAEMPAVIRRLSHSQNYFLIVDFSRLGEPLPEDLEIEGGQLFDWLPAAASLHSPHVVALAEFLDWPTLIEDGWGSDGIIGIQTSLEKAEFVNLLRDLIGGSIKGNATQRSIVGICWPSVLKPLLETDSEKTVSQLMPAMNHVLVETSDGFQIFLLEAQLKPLLELGFTVTET